MKLIKEAKENFDGMTIEEIFWKVAGHKFPVFKKDGTLTKQAEHLYGKAAKAYGEDAFDKLCADEHCFKESLKEAKENKIILNDAQKKKVLDYLFGEFGVYTFYKDKLDREWYITDDKSLDPVRSDSDDAAFPMVLVIDGKFVDALTKEFVDKITSLKEGVDEQKHLEDMIAYYTKYVETAKEEDKTFFKDFVEYLKKKLDRLKNGDGLKESVQLNEGTSNFWTQEGLPLYAFLTTDEVADRVRERIYSDDEYDEEDDDKYYGLEDKYYTELENDGYVVIDLDDGELEDAIDKFNDRTRELSYEAYDKYDDLNRKWQDGRDTLSDEELDKIMEEANQWYDASDYLEGMKLKIKDGYYEGAQLYLDGWDRYAIAALPEEAKNDIVDRYNQIGKDFGLMKLAVAYRASNGETGYNLIKESKTLTERRWNAVIKAGIELRDALDEGDDLERVREAILACYDELYDKGLIDEYDHDDWTEEVRDYDFDNEDDVDFELGQLYDLCDNIGAFLAVTDVDLDESLSQEIGQAYRELSAKYGVDVDKLVSEFMKAKYPKGFPDFNGDVIYSEKHWNEFVDWCKQEKGVNLGESCKRCERKNKKALKESADMLHIEDLNTGDTRILDAGQYYTSLELPDEAYWEDDWNKTKENLKRWDKWILECARPVIENALHEVSSDIKLVGELSYYHPAKYNFETDRIYFDVELPKETLDRLVEENIKKPEFLQFLKDHYTSRDGFWSHMANNSDGFMEQDDWKKLTSILAFNLSDSFDSRQRDFVEEIVYDWGDLEVHYDDDMNESLEGRDRKKFITLLTNELQKEPLAYSRDEANDIAIKRADALGKNPYDSIEALVKSEVSKTRSKKDESLNESAGDFCKHYTREELLAHSREVFKALLPEDKILLGSRRPIETDRDFAYAGTIKCEDDELIWEYFGRSANDATLEDFEWIINTIFKDCQHFVLCSTDNYYDRAGKHYEDEIAKRNASLKEDTVKQGNAWVNKGKEGTHGKFKTKKAADAQRKAMFANGYQESLKESADDTKALIDFLKSLKLDDEVEEKVIGDWTVDAWTTEPILNFSRGFYIVQIDNDKLNKHFSISDCMSQKELEYERDRVIKDRLGKLLKESAGDDVLYIATSARGNDVKVFSSLDARYKHSEDNTGWQYWEVPKKEFKSLAKQMNRNFAFNRLHQEGKTKVSESLKEAKNDYIGKSFDDVSKQIRNLGYKEDKDNRQKDADRDVYTYWKGKNNLISVYVKNNKVDEIRGNLIEEAWDTDFDNKRVRRDIIGWWDAVERWNDEHDRPYSIDNGDKEHATAQEVEEMLVAMWDMLLALRDEQKDSDEAKALLRRGKRIYNKYAGLSQFTESVNTEKVEEGVGATVASMVAGKAIETLGDMANQMIDDNSFKGESLEEGQDDKFYAYMILDDKFDELDTPVDSEFEEKGLHTIDDIKEYVKKTYPNAKRIVKMCYTFDNEQMKECEDEFEIINLDDAKVEEKVGASKESAHKEPDNKPEGNWAWDKDACDWYDKDTDTFHSETIKEEVVEESIDPETYVEDMEGFDDIDFLEESIFDAPIITDLFGDYDC